MPKFKAQLSVESIQELIDKVQEYKNKVDALEVNATEKVTSRVSNEIERNLFAVTDKDGNVDAKAGEFTFGNTGFAYLSGSQAAYIEFGTGPKGAESPHPQAGENVWKYGTSGDGRIFTTKDGRIGWLYKDKTTGRWKFTEGIAAQEVVLKASESVKREIPKIVKELLK